ncbi:Coatomer beta subunit [Trema orientale]|uniref:Coatomer beta subunit n=1 Tax=Trema orientale TaxID=63057 RepID=A0A2P5G1U3_TREOI|nr:Coatomer beta subunit [Trema orientale]
MKREKEVEKSLNGMFNPPSSPCFNRGDDDHRHFVGGSSLDRGSRQSEYSHSNSLSNGFDCSSSLSPFEDLREVLLNSSHDYSQTKKEELVNDLGLPESLCRMHIRDKQEEGTKIRGFDWNPDGFGLGDGSFGGPISCNFQSYGQYEDFKNDPSDYEAFRTLNGGVPASFDGDMRFKPLRFQQGCNVGDETGSPLTHIYHTSRNSSPRFNHNQMSNVLGKTHEQDGGRCYRDVQLQNPISKPYRSGNFVCSQLHGMDSNGGKGIRGSLSSPKLLQPNQGVNMNNPLHSVPMMKGRSKAKTPVFEYKQYAGDLKGFSCEDSFIIEGKCSSAVTKERKSPSHKKSSHNDITISNERGKSFSLDCHSRCREIHENRWRSRSDLQLPSPPLFCSLDELQSYIYLIAKDQYGCRTLQTLFDEGTSQAVQIIFDGVIDHVVELSTNAFGNYLVQKLLDVCSKEQKLHIVLVMTQEPGQLVKISLNTHGTRVVQKLIETAKDRELVYYLMSALEPGFLELIKDLNGNHVVLRCLHCLTNEDNSPIFDAAAKFCVEIATHRHGCCVLQRCISHSTGKYQLKLVKEILNNALHLAQDPYGNYVVQFIIELRLPSATAKLTSQFKGHYVYLSTKKFSSHVVEKCLKHLKETRPRIIYELLSVSHFDHLLQDPYANYVIQSALEGAGVLHDSLVRAVRPHTSLRTSPFCKKIFSNNLLKK